MKGGERAVYISIKRYGKHNVIKINGVIRNAEDYKITSSADGTTELVIKIKSDRNVVKCDSLTRIE